MSQDSYSIKELYESYMSDETITVNVRLSDYGDVNVGDFNHDLKILLEEYQKK